MTPFRSEKNTNWEGAFRVPQMIRWPGKIPAGVVSNEIVQHHDWLPTFLAAAGDPDIVEKLKQGHEPATRPSRSTSTATTCCPYLTGEADRSPRQGFVYFSDDGDLVALRFDNWKVVFMEQRVPGHARRSGPSRSSSLRVPKIFNLRTDPFERADITSNTYWDWFLDNDYIALAAHRRHDPVPGDVRASSRPRQKAASFTIDQAVAKLEAALTARPLTGGDRARRHAVDSGRGVPHGLGRPLPGGGARARRVASTGFWIDCCQVTNRAVRRVRRARPAT